MIDYAPNFKNSSASEFDDTEKLFFCYQSAVFLSQQDMRYAISKEIATRFSISLTAVHFCGSAHIGSSPHRQTPFKEGESDLDVAIVSPQLFEEYLLISMNNSRGLTDPSCFPVDHSTQRPTKEQFCQYAARGMFRPDLMPNCSQRSSWITFFSRMSKKYSTFSNINAGLYLSERLFLEKQRSSVAKLRGTKEI